MLTDGRRDALLFSPIFFTPFAAVDQRLKSDWWPVRTPIGLKR